MDRLEEIGKYWNGRAAGYETVSNEEFGGGPGDLWREIFREEIPAGSGVLDAGAGAGFFSMVLADMGYRVTGIDYSEEMVNSLRRNMAERGLPCEITRMDAQHLEFADGSFDAIVSRNMIWALEDPVRGYAEMYRVLRPGGKLIVEDANHYLHLYNEDYRAEMEGMRRRFEEFIKDHGEPEIPWGNADPRVMEDIARDLPLSRELRPVWDEKALSGLGFRVLRVETKSGMSPFGRGMYMEETESSLVKSFYLIAVKE